MGVGLHLNEGEYHLLIAGDIDPMEVEEDLHLNGGGDHLLIATLLWQTCAVALPQQGG
jgi:hypothetical protein